MPPILKENKFYLPIVVSTIAIAAAVFFTISATSILRNKKSYINESHIKSKAQAQLLGENASSVLYTADFTLLSISSIIGSQCDEDRVTVSPSAESFITNEVTFLPHIKNLILLDSQEEITYSINKVANFTLPSFEEHKDAWIEFATGILPEEKPHPFIFLSRRIENKHGIFAGVIVAIIDSAFFYERYDSYLTIDADMIVLFDNKEKILSGWFNNPDSHKDIRGQTMSSLTYFDSISNLNLISGGYKTHETDNAIISTYQLRDFPYYVAVMYTKDSILEKWQKETKKDTLMILITSIISLFTIVLAIKQGRKRTIAEARLLQHQLDLEDTVERRTKELQKTNLALIEKNGEIEKALKEIKTLRGIVPICSFCKNIRDDKGYWERVEVYVKRHSEADFSHSICPKCAKEHYPDIDIYGTL
ncbi:membrane hypothetical protein [Desulfamplus magnetovallimortis]|uniref:Uncharacterized protein n=1 Tax=Desulfamplus magnetovallimortis TaxID=1246637 RepID=A0A1W1H6G2_9BACT|nr:cache domain-containing protein [Desulfamplus magnetovallimortis]SLM28026.1 membrane hypothetical protein [Desulfamplus magnetovallimortis]